MKKYYYDFHIHSCLSPCADDENTPFNIAGMAKLCGLDMIALTDHNSCKNCPAFFKACENYGIIPIAGAEVTTAEDIHVICLFENPESALEFDSELQSHRTLIENRTDIFGNQYIYGEDDSITDTDKYYLSVATDLSLDEMPVLVSKFGGVCYPAHIDRQANGIISVLGTFPDIPEFKIAEINDKDKVEEYTEKYALQDKLIIISSDAHYLTGIKDKENYIELDAESGGNEIRHALFEKLRKL